jgi:peptidoglycan DL-endopeptidase CwlO
VHTAPWHKAVRQLTVVRKPKVVSKHSAAVAAAVLGAGLLFCATGSAGASPAPTLAQVQKKVSQLQLKSDRLGQQYDQVLEQKAATKQRLALLERQLAIYNQEFTDLRDAVSRIAVADYMDGNISASLTLLTSGDPQQILDQSSILQELSNTNSAEISQFLSAARQLENTQEVVRRTETGIDQLQASLGGRRKAMNKLLSQEQALLAQLTPAQQASIGDGGETGTTPVKYTGPTTTQADKAIAYAYDQVGCPYVYGGTGPCSQGFDCSGLTMMSWAAAGVSIPRTSYEQWDDLPHVSLDDVQPGDILVFYDAGHVALYIGHNEFIQAPQTGQDVQIVTYQGADTPGIDGAVQP